MTTKCNVVYWVGPWGNRTLKKIKEYGLGPCASVGWSIFPYTKWLLVPSPVRVQVLVAGSVPVKALRGGNW